MTALPTPRYDGDFTSPADMYRSRYFDGEHLTIRAAHIYTGDPLQPETPGLAIETKNGRLVTCLVLEHADRLTQLLTAFIGGQDKEN